LRQTSCAQTQLLSAGAYPDPALNSHSSFVKARGAEYLVISICMVARLAEVNDDTLTDIASHRRGLGRRTGG